MAVQFRCNRWGLSCPVWEMYHFLCLSFLGVPTRVTRSPLCFWAPVIVMMKAKLGQLVIREIQLSRTRVLHHIEKEKKKKKREEKEKRPYHWYIGYATISSTLPGNGGGGQRG